DVGKLKAKEDIGVFVGYSKKSAAFRIYNKRTRKIHESVNVNFDEISEMASKQFSLEPGLSNLNETRKSSNRSVSKVDEASKKDLEDLFQDFYDEYFDSSKCIGSYFAMLTHLEGHQKVVSGIALHVGPDKLYTRSKDETVISGIALHVGPDKLYTRSKDETPDVDGNRTIDYINFRNSVDFISSDLDKLEG
nr:zinc finger WD40 repeat protein 1 [Tanacetum cinerariifolium]